MKHLYLLLIVLPLSTITYSQSEYFATDSTAAYGIKLVDGGDLTNSQFCQLKKGDKTIQYTPYEVKEYGLKDGRVYLSKEIPIADSIKRVFLQRMVKGETTLYYYRGKGRKTFFIEKDSTLFIELPRRNVANERFTEQLVKHTSDCPAVADVCELVRYNNRSLSKFITRYNNCELKPFPHFRYGVLIGYESTKLVPTETQDEYLNHLNFSYDGSFSFGIFIDQPIVVSNFSVHAEMLYSKHGYSYNKFIEDKEIDFVANLSSVKMPLLLRYTYPSNKVRPFINAGFIAAYYLKNETLLLETIFTDNSIFINNTEVQYELDNLQLGYGIGAGTEYKLNSKRSLFFEFRLNSLYNQKSSVFSGNNSFTLLTGINF